MSNGLPASRARLADLALAVYLAPLLAGRRVAVVGPSSGEVARRARVLGAATVVAFGGTGEDIAVRALTPGAVAAFHGKLDVILVPDAGAVPSLVAVLDEARRALGSEGIIAVASEPADAPGALEAGGRHSVGYHDLHELCAARFASVRMLGRGPFLGYTVATLDEAGERVSLDTRLIDGDPPRPEAFLAVASDGPLTLDPLTVVQIPPEVLIELRASATRGADEELARRDQKLKEVEAASAERWVRIQRYEHGLKELEEENRKARDRSVRLSKDLEDERKLRQRVELEAQMSRRAPELPRAPDLEPELRRAREQAAQLEQDLAAARAETVAARARIHDLERELDETQSGEADLRGQLDEALERPAVVDHGPELAQLRQRVAELRAELATVRDSARDAAGEARGALEAAQHTAHKAHGALGAAQAEVERLRLTQAPDEVAEDYLRVERELAARGAEVRKLQAEREQLHQAVRELSFTVEGLQREDVAVEARALRERIHEMRSVHGALAEKAEEIVHENSLLRERIAHLESDVLAGGVEARQASAQAAELRAELDRLRAQAVLEAPVAPGTPGTPGTPGAHDPESHSREAQLLGSLAGMTVRAHQCEATVLEIERQLAEERATRDYHRAAVDEARTEVSRLYALNASLEARLAHLRSELEGAHAGAGEARAEVSRLLAHNAGLDARWTDLSQEFERSRTGLLQRIADLEGETDRLARALEVAGTQAAWEGSQTFDARTRELEALRAELQGMAWRLREAEASLTVRRAAPAQPAPQAKAESPGVDVGMDLLADDEDAESESRFRMDQVLADLSATAERLAQTEEALARAQAAQRAAEQEAEGFTTAQDDALLTLKAQLADREARLDAFERRLADEVSAMRQTLALEERANHSLRASLDSVRTGLSSILIDGRGAVVAHDLVLILRQIEGNG